MGGSESPLVQVSELSQGPLSAHCCPCMSGTGENPLTIADPYDPTGFDVAGDVEGHQSVVWCELGESYHGMGGLNPPVWITRSEQQSGDRACGLLWG
jgi:hypothetical protein